MAFLRNGTVKFVGDPHWHKREGKKYLLPGKKVEGMYIEAIDASGTELMFEGIFYIKKLFFAMAITFLILTINFFIFKINDSQTQKKLNLLKIDLFFKVLTIYMTWNFFAC